MTNPHKTWKEYTDCFLSEGNKDCASCRAYEWVEIGKIEAELAAKPTQLDRIESKLDDLLLAQKPLTISIG
jgi:hypothetical protein